MTNTAGTAVRNASNSLDSLTFSEPLAFLGGASPSRINNNEVSARARMKPTDAGS